MDLNNFFWNIIKIIHTEISIAENIKKNKVNDNIETSSYIIEYSKKKINNDIQINSEFINDLNVFSKPHIKYIIRIQSKVFNIIISQLFMKIKTTNYFLI